MNKNLLFFNLILFFVQITYPMIQSYDTRKHIKQFNYVKKPISINLHELARTNITIIGSLPFIQACKKVHKLIHPHNYLSDDQELFLNVLALPFDLSLPILFGKDYNKKQAMIEVFCSQPVGKALELYSMLAEKYAKDKKLASLISFDELYTHHTSYIELYDATKYFFHNLKGIHEISREQLNRSLNEIIILPVPNPEDAYKINYQKITMLILLPDNVKNAYNINNKKFLLTTSYKELLSKRLEKTIGALFGLDLLCVVTGRNDFSVGTNVMLGGCIYWFILCWDISDVSKTISNMKPLTLSDFQKFSVLEKILGTNKG